MTSISSISFKKRDEADEIYTFPIDVKGPTFQTKNSVVMVEYLDNGEALIIAGKLPGMQGYYKNYPDVVESDESKQRQHRFARKLLEEAKEYLEEYDPQTSSSESHSGNQHLNSLYVTVEEKERDKVVMKMWQILNHMRERYIDFLEDYEDDEYLDYPGLEEEILEISKTLGCQ